MYKNILFVPVTVICTTQISYETVKKLKWTLGLTILTED